MPWHRLRASNDCRKQALRMAQGAQNIDDRSITYHFHHIHYYASRHPVGGGRGCAGRAHHLEECEPFRATRRIPCHSWPQWSRQVDAAQSYSWTDSTISRQAVRIRSPGAAGQRGYWLRATETTF